MENTFNNSVKAMSIEEFGEKVYHLLQKKLNRGDNHVSNIAINKVVKVYVEMGIKKPSLIIDHLTQVKPAKSIELLIDNIICDRKEGTRTDGQKRDFSGLEF